MIYFSIIARVWLGSMFLYAAGLKLVWYDQNGCHVKAYQLIPESVAPTVGSLILCAEFFTGISLLTGWFFPLGTLVGAFLGASFAYASLRVLLKKADVPCGCAGKSNSHVDWATMTRAIFIVIFSIALFLLEQGGGIVFQPVIVFLIILISLLPAVFALNDRIRFTKLYKQRIQQDEEEIARITRLLATHPIQ